MTPVPAGSSVPRATTMYRPLAHVGAEAAVTADEPAASRAKERARLRIVAVSAFFFILP